jgi:uncharacterized protein (TIGR02271 family)
MLSTIENPERLTSGSLLASDGSKIGGIADIYVDRETRQPEWALVHTGMFGTKETFVPLAEATRQGDDLVVPYDKATVKDAPRVDADGELTEAEEAELYRHYGLGYSENRSGSGLPDTGGARDVMPATARRGTDEGRDTSGPNTDTAMTRSEEELRVSKTRRPSELVRLRKYIVTEQKQVTVPVQREEFRVEREPITDANRAQAMAGPDLSTEEHELMLNREDVVVDKEVVPRERVRLEKETVTEDRTVSEELRQERIDVEREGGRDGGTDRLREGERTSR